MKTLILCGNDVIELILEFIVGRCHEIGYIMNNICPKFYPSLPTEIRQTFLRKYLTPDIVPDDYLFIDGDSLQKVCIPESIETIKIAQNGSITSGKHDTRIDIRSLIIKRFIVPELSIIIGNNSNLLANEQTILMKYAILSNIEITAAHILRTCMYNFSENILRYKQPNTLQITANLLQYLLIISTEISTLEIFRENTIFLRLLSSVSTFMNITQYVIHGTFEFQVTSVKNDIRYTFISDQENRVDVIFTDVENLNLSMFPRNMYFSNEFLKCFNIWADVFNISSCLLLKSNITFSDSVRVLYLYEHETNIESELDLSHDNYDRICCIISSEKRNIIYPKNLRVHILKTHVGELVIDVTSILETKPTDLWTLLENIKKYNKRQMEGQINDNTQKC